MSTSALETQPSRAPRGSATESSNDGKPRAARGDARTARSSAASALNPEKVVAGVAGAALVSMGLERRSWRGLAIALIGGELLRPSFTGKSILTRALDLTGESPNRDQIGAPPESPSVERAITIGGSPRELYDVWRDPSQLSRILEHWVEVTSTSPDRMHWSVRGPTGKSLEWEAQITDDRPGELIRWASLPGADVPNEGSIAFSPGPEGWGSEVQLSMRFDPPGGKIGEFVANHFGIAPRLGVERSLRRFKSLVETGEMPTLEHNVSARGAGDLW